MPEKPGAKTSQINTRPERFGPDDFRADEIDDLWGAAEEAEAPRSGDPTGRAAATLPRNLGRTVSDVSGDDKYLIERELARGGMGVALLAFDRDVRRHVVMKVMKDRTDAEHRARFVEEAQVTGQLEHPNIMPVHDLGMDATGRLFFTMKHVKGQTLAQILDDCRECATAVAEERHPLPFLLHILTHVCEAVAFAHGRGVVHRDLKPGNIMVGDHGEIYVMDWGLAKVGSAQRSSDRIVVSDPAAAGGVPLPRAAGPHPPEELIPEEQVASHRHDSALCITRDGTVAGTPAYMSPEQARADLAAVGSRSDIYGLGAILYEILTLFPPVQGRDDEEYIDNAKAGRILPPERRTLKRAIPPELSRAALKALSLDPACRHASALELKRELDAYIGRQFSSDCPRRFAEATALLARRHPAAVFLLLTGISIASAALALIITRLP